MAETTKFPVKKGPSVPVPSGWSEMDQLRQEMDRIFDAFGGGLFSMPSRWTRADLDLPRRGARQPMEPTVDIVERADRYEVIAELPGMDEKDVEVKLSNGNLVISGEKKEEREERDANYHMSERRYGSFQRSFRLPESTKADKIEATFKNGVLTIAIPKDEEAKKETKINVKAA